MEDLRPRKYQEEIFSRARNENVIAALDTGSGKTFISTQLIKWVASQEHLSKDKVILFLVPRVPLVEQQASYLEKHTPLRICRLSGEVDLTNLGAWRTLFRESDVFVMTPQIFVNLLTHAHWNIEKVSLLIFDECHHTRKNHPFNSIMRQYLHTPASQRPRIFGMTASPIWNPQRPGESLAQLEANLSAKVIGVLDNEIELQGYSPKPQELVKTYPPPPSSYAEYAFPGLYDFFSNFSFSEEHNFPWSTIQTRYSVALDILGPYPADLYLFNEASRHIPFRHVLPMESPTLSTTDDLYPLHSILIAYQNSFDIKTAHSIPLAWCTPRISYLVQVLTEYYSPTFQGIVFVEQRHIAIFLAQILPRIPELSDKIYSGALVGHDGISAVDSHQNNKKNIAAFRERKLNLLVATSVAEEGLDFPACDLVVRLDGLKTLISYVQSRGRARKHDSKFVFMVEEGDELSLQQYNTFREIEPKLRTEYQRRHPKKANLSDEEGDDMDDDTHPDDLMNRERYVVTKTNSIITYDNSIALINWLCSLLPQNDPYRPPAKPKYTGSFTVTLRLPPQIPLPRELLKYVGQPKRSKQEAKRAVAFLAAKSLHKLGILNDNLLPAGYEDESADTSEDLMKERKKIPLMMDVLVKSPWMTSSQQLWLHILEVDQLDAVGLVVGTWIPLTEMSARAHHIRVQPISTLDFDSYGMEPAELRYLLDRYTRIGIKWLLTGQKLGDDLGLFVAPLTRDWRVDVLALRAVVEHPDGRNDWSEVGLLDNTVVMNRYRFGRAYAPLRIRHDLTPMSCPSPGTREAGFASYHDYFTQVYIRRPEKQMPVPLTGPLIEGIHLPRDLFSQFDLCPATPVTIYPSAPDGVIFPLECSKWLEFSQPLRLAFQLLSPICHRLSGVYRARQARCDLALPFIPDDLMVEALTIPQSNDVFSNQRLETLGDAVLQLAATVHVYNEHPYKHEGQLTVLRRRIVSNKNLRTIGKAAFLEEYIIGEHVKEKKWRYDDKGLGKRCRRLIPRRSLQDCVEAILGASYLSGGFTAVLRTGVAFGIEFGGMAPWQKRPYSVLQATLDNRAGALFGELQASLGYTFHHPGLLREACTHSTFLSEDSPGYSYERLEFLGDSLIEMVVTEYLYKKFPTYNSGYLSRARARLVCASVLGYIAVHKLSLHKYALYNNTGLSKDLAHWVQVFSETTPRAIVRDGWKYDPPKMISDVLESTLGAVLVDSSWNYDLAAAVTSSVMENVLEIIGEETVEHPMALLLEWCGKQGCTRVIVRKLKSSASNPHQRPGAEVLFHDNIIIGPIYAHTRQVAKGLAAEKALSFLRDDGRFEELCNCRQRKRALEELNEMLVEGVQNLSPKPEYGKGAMDVLAQNGD